LAEIISSNEPYSRYTIHPFIKADSDMAFCKPLKKGKPPAKVGTALGITIFGGCNGFGSVTQLA
jgi:hypothetical protein